MFGEEWTQAVISEMKPFGWRYGTPILDDEDDDNDMDDPNYNPDHYDSEDDNDYYYNSKDDGDDDAGANDPQHIFRSGT